MSSTDHSDRTSVKHDHKKMILIIALLSCFTIVNVTIFSTLSNIETQQPNPMPQKAVITNQNQYEFLDKMSCSEVKEFIDDVGTRFTGDYQADGIKAHASVLWNDCLGKLSQKYQSIYETNKGWFGMINGKSVPLEYHP